LPGVLEQSKDAFRSRHLGNLGLFPCVIVTPIRIGASRMANPEHLKVLKQGAVVWNEWRQDNPEARPNLRKAELRGENLRGYNFNDSNLRRADLSKIDLSRSFLRRADLRRTNLSGATLREVDLTSAILIETNLHKAVLDGCLVYGVSAWNIRLDGAKQKNLIVSKKNEPIFMVDNLEVAQFIYLLLNNQRIREVITTVGQRAVLILGRFSRLIPLSQVSLACGCFAPHNAAWPGDMPP
jgi:hypothetical protein